MVLNKELHCKEMRCYTDFYQTATKLLCEVNMFLSCYFSGLHHQNISQASAQSMATKVALMCVASVLAAEPMPHNCDFSHCNAKFIVAASWSPFSGAPGWYKKWIHQLDSWGILVCVCEKTITKEVVKT